MRDRLPRLIENVESFEVTFDEAGFVHLKFMDLFGQGEEYTFSLADAVRISDALSEVSQASAMTA